MSAERCVLLLRAVNVGGNNRVPMAELRTALTGREGFGEVSTYIASGNVICDAPADPKAACAQVRALIHDTFGVDTPVILRTHADLARVLADNPFPDAAQEKMLHAMFLEGEPLPTAIEALTPRLQPGERIALRGVDLWIDYGAGGVQSTKLTRPVLDRALGVAGTARNLLTVRKLADLTAG
ncbi:DUF1697 domain-containing protein [Microbacterium azadirachtae]|uniref:DUF1697 domain-containing protein n=1 Tax=Microbacterium azadirachtae TaxID=582680 RepID=UPI000883D3E1|nr:DUF1697 domain-containing protein [Microbacterium azadirachtae]UXW85080.1 DUF1697 domain-containing protein [Microbacterium azadirachtae]SDM07142.1 Uncharacterized conserved protein, DUF1697 family [Microbacterium azadirachtae]SEG32205.1 Uncharacterized conserved protein, DUF1697 family [Microbacterium azadirachtae]SEG35383.1 Uncharacterized conserved protein, DUF1697 family [Microbacterium azadirachtae]